MYETDSKGNCVKNGPHCAFAHGAHDLRPPIYDIRELQGVETPDLKASLGSSSGTPSSLEKDKIPAEDSKCNGNSEFFCLYKLSQIVNEVKTRKNVCDLITMPKV